MPASQDEPASGTLSPRSLSVEMPSASNLDPLDEPASVSSVLYPPSLSMDRQMQPAGIMAAQQNSRAVYLTPGFYANATRFLKRDNDKHPIVVATSAAEPYNTSSFWVSDHRDQPPFERGCKGWATILLVVAQTLVREIALESTDVPPSLKTHEYKTLLHNVYYYIEKAVGSKVMLAALDQSL
jgi:hypothetical protein